MLLYVIPPLLATLIVVFHIYIYIQRRKYRHIPSLPIPLSWQWITGHAPVFLAKAKEVGFNFAAIFESIRHDVGKENETIVVFRGLRQNSYLIYSVKIDFFSKVMSDHRTFWKIEAKTSPLAYTNGLRIAGHNAIVLEPGTEIWYHKRKMMDPAFQKKFLKSLMEKMNDSANKLSQYLRGLPNRKNVDMYKVFMRVALEVVCTCGFNLDDDFINLEDSKMNNAVNTVFAEVMSAVINIRTYWMPWKHREAKKALEEAIHLLRDTMRKHLQHRFDAVANGTDTTNDILSHIIRGNMFSDKLTMEDLVDDFFIFLVAGMETTAITMSTFIWYFIKCPEVAQKAIKEINDVYGDKEDLEFEDLNKLVYLDQCIKETLRLHPPVQQTFRRNHHSDVTVAGIHVPQGTRIVVPLETVQRSELYWKDPMTFDPERFGHNVHTKPFTYFPFSAGPRSCIGKHFSIMESKIVLSKLFKDFQFFDPYPEERVLEKVSILTARPKHGVFVTLEGRGL